MRIPAELLPADGRFCCGPSKVRPSAVEALSNVASEFLGTSHRQKTVKDQVARLRSGISTFFALPEGYEVIIGNGGTTAFWEVAAFSLIRDRAQFATFGEFGAKFAKAVKDAPFLGTPTVHKGEPGGAAFLVAEEGVDAYGITHNETSTGVAVPVQRVSGADSGALMLHDATSAAAIMSALVNVLLMTRRRRSEPVSGAKVKPDLRTSETASASPTEKASARNDGREIETRWSASSGARHFTRGSICE